MTTSSWGWVPCLCGVSSVSLLFLSCCRDRDKRCTRLLQAGGGCPVYVLCAVFPSCFTLVAEIGINDVHDYFKLGVGALVGIVFTVASCCIGCVVVACVCRKRRKYVSVSVYCFNLEQVCGSTLCYLDAPPTQGASCVATQKVAISSIICAVLLLHSVWTGC